jgi:hypothetical protein
MNELKTQYCCRHAMNGFMCSDCVSLQLAKRQEEFVKMVEKNIINDDFGKECLFADIKSKLK